MNIIMKPTAELIPYAQNAKVHDKKQVANVANSIKRFGWQQPIVIDDNDVVVIGHCRLMAAKNQIERSACDNRQRLDGRGNPGAASC